MHFEVAWSKTDTAVLARALGDVLARRGSTVTVRERASMAEWLAARRKDPLTIERIALHQFGPTAAAYGLRNVLLGDRKRYAAVSRAVGGIGWIQIETSGGAALFGWADAGAVRRYYEYTGDRVVATGTPQPWEPPLEPFQPAPRDGSPRRGPKRLGPDGRFYMDEVDATLTAIGLPSPQSRDFDDLGGGLVLDVVSPEGPVEKARSARPWWKLW